MARLYDRHARRIFGFCLYQLRKQDEAEDAVQMTFMYALGALRRGVVPAAESAWLLKIARNVCLSRFDAARRRRNVEEPRDPLVLEETAPAWIADDADAPDLRAALARLPERQCRAIVMREWQGLSYAEIATELGIGIAAVETLIFRARQSLARELRGEQQDAKRRALDLWSLLGWAKSLLGGGAAKIAIGAAAVASVGAAVSVPLVEHSSPGAKRPASVSTQAAAVQAAPAAAAAPSSPGAAKPLRSHTAHRTHATRVTSSPAQQVESPGATPAAGTPAAVTTTTQPAQSQAESPTPPSPPPPTSTPAVPAASAPAAAAAATPAPVAAAPPTPTAQVDLPALPPVQAPSLPPVQVPALPTVSTPSLPTPPPVQLPPVPPVPSLPDPPKLPKLP